jgi:hypothetical protein
MVAWTTIGLLLLGLAMLTLPIGKCPICDGSGEGRPG